MASMPPFAGLLPRPMSTPYPDTIEDQARRDLFEHQGLEFQDRESPYRITLEFDVPKYIAYSNRSDILAFLLNRLARAVRRGKLHKPSTERDKRTVFFLVTYSLWDLDRVSFRENQTAVLVLERIAHILRSKVTYETHMKDTMPWWPEPSRLRALRVYRLDPSTRKGVFLW
ncbi:hypothetical protein N8T08_008697 [Aspergillus melleus]|uniref:Uncharacterized protein n=1 Tax=Aspergillus melleus TaxID=138277 RepID=A0ACC3BE56_9EURO|nr:hypothetical protein N8T08_008697 [Aspergillus melleus]